VTAQGRPRRSRHRIALALALVVAVSLLLLAAGCGGEQSSLDPKGPQASKIDSLWWVMMTVAWAGLAFIVFLLLLAYRRRRRTGSERAGWTVVITNGIAAPIVVLVALFIVGDVFLIRSTQAPAATDTKLTVQVIGHQWWWEVRYPGTTAVTANEIHIPARTPVNLEVTTADVIHSFWVPQLNRKIDTIPGQVNRIELDADHPGTFRGQCAEFCGIQHAHMAMRVIAQTPADFQAWLAHESAPSPAPAGGAAAAGYTTFLDKCSSCHMVRGTPADGDVGPDLTHLASRGTIGAVTLENGPQALAKWITDNQSVKPGNDMPDFPYSGRALDDLVAYLTSLR
jgi:cytochrome c oxidase subunit 2